MKEINFLGLGIQAGQDKQGLNNSHDYFRQYFSFFAEQGIKISDRGEICEESTSHKKLYSNNQIALFSWSPYEQAYNYIQELLKDNKTLLNWGGDHSIALATVAAFCLQNPTGYVVWIDAHADINLPEHSLSGHLHGMPLAILLDIQNVAAEHFPWLLKKLSAKNIIYVGVRDLDPFEERIIHELGIKVFTSEHIKHVGMPAIAKQISNLVSNHPLHISFDIDSLSPEVAPATGVPVSNGLSIEDLEILGRSLAKNPFLKSLDVVEINPSLDNDQGVFRTYYAALRFLMSVFYQGEFYDDISRSEQPVSATSLESGLSI